MKKYIKSIVTLVAICAVVSVLMAFTNYITAPKITENEEKKVNEALTEVLPGAESFELLDTAAYSLPEEVVAVYKASNGGYVVKLNVKGFSPNMTIMCGVDESGDVSGAVCLSSAETLGAEKTYGESFAGKDAVGAEAVDTVSGATVTTTAYKQGILDALRAVEIIKGGNP